MPLEVFDLDLKEWRVMSDSELAACRVVDYVRYEVPIRTAGESTRTTMTEDEIRAAQLAERMEILESMWDIIGKDPTEAERRMAQYLRMLAFVPTGLLRKAVDRAMLDNGRFPTVPTPGAIVEALRVVLGKPYDLDAAVKRWCEGIWANAVYEFVPSFGYAQDDYAQDGPSFELAEAVV